MAENEEQVMTGQGDGIPDNWDAGDQTLAYPNGEYIFAWGKLVPVFKEGQEDRSEPSSIAHEIWVIKFLGNSEVPAQARIQIKEGKALMAGTRGTKRIEFYANPKFQPKMAWKASAFFSQFKGCIEEITLSQFDDKGELKKKKVVSWVNVKALYGTVFQCGLKWTKSKKDGKMYCNFDLDTLQVPGARIPANDMAQIEQLYDSLKKRGEASESSASSATSAEDAVEDLPF